MKHRTNEEVKAMARRAAEEQAAADLAAPAEEPAIEPEQADTNQTSEPRSWFGRWFKR